MKPEAAHVKAVELSEHALRMTTAAGAGHPSSALSLAHIVTVLMYEHMRFDPKNPWNRAADRLVLSAGHAVPMVYAAYADLGGVVGHGREDARVLTTAELDTLRDLDSVLDGHPNPAEGFPFFDAATGSLGMGLSVAAGIRLAARLEGSDRRVYCIIGDGESREGQIWEAADFAADHGIGGLCAIFNCNGAGQANTVSPMQTPERLQDKLVAFGWEVTVIDGHDPAAIDAALTAFEQNTEKPCALVARTQKGWGVDFMLGHNYHGKPVGADELDTAYASLRTHAPTAVAGLDATPPAPPSAPPSALNIETAAVRRGRRKRTICQGCLSRKTGHALGYGVALAAAGAICDDIVALDGDVMNSTFADHFARTYPDRFFDGKIAEQNIVSAAAGMSAAGKIPFVSTFGKFFARAYDQIELAIISRANVKLVGSHSGLGPASDGPSQMALADISFLRSYASVDNGRGQPACLLFNPADAHATYRMCEVMANHPGVCYMRTHRPDVPFIYDADELFDIGGIKVLREGSDLTIVASGVMVTEALTAWAELDAAGIHCTLIDAYTLPITDPALLDAAARSGGRILTVEDNYCGSFGSAVADLAARRGDCVVEQLVVDRIPKSARKPADLMAHLGLSTAHIVARAKVLAGKA